LFFSFCIFPFFFCIIFYRLCVFFFSVVPILYTILLRDLTRHLTILMPPTTPGFLDPPFWSFGPSALFPDGLRLVLFPPRIGRIFVYLWLSPAPALSFLSAPAGYFSQLSCIFVLWTNPFTMRLLKIVVPLRFSHFVFVFSPIFLSTRLFL